MAVVTVFRMATTGRELRVERLLAEVSVVAIAARMGLSRQAVWALERMASVKADRALAYRAALRDASATSEEVA
jgi:transcriptional regulator with XRE-family HTH domain